MKTMYALILLSLVLVGGVALAGYGRGRIDRRTVSNLEPDDLLGRWYELARYDHRFERGMSHVEAIYTLNDDGTIRVENSGIEDKSGKRVVKVGRAKWTDQPGRLRVSFFWIFYADYNILEWGDKGEWMLVGSHSPKYLWILSRTPTLPPKELDYILELARLRGYDTSKLMIENPDE